MYMFVLMQCFYPHMLIGKVWIYHLLFVCLYGYGFFSTKEKTSGAKFFTAVYRRLRQGISHFWENFAPPEAQNRTNRPPRPCCNVMLLGFCDSHAYQVRAACGRRIGMCGYTSVPKD